MSFFRHKDWILPVTDIERLLVGEDYVDVLMRASSSCPSYTMRLEGMEAINLLLRVCPQALEGDTRFKWHRHRWAFHNLVAHPVMQVLALFGFGRLGIRLHDVTIPVPYTIDSSKKTR
jgi:hypothetical protein